jgi:hypothetical protein
MGSSDRRWYLRQNSSGAYNREKYLMARTGMTCECCGETFPRELLEFHHPPDVKKTMSLRMRAWRGVHGPKQETLDEADQCVILCSNCHRLEHVALKRGESLVHDPSAYRRYRNHRVTRYESLDDWLTQRSRRGTQLSLSF